VGFLVFDVTNCIGLLKVSTQEHRDTQSGSSTAAREQTRCIVRIDSDDCIEFIEVHEQSQTALRPYDLCHTSRARYSSASCLREDTMEGSPPTEAGCSPSHSCLHAPSEKYNFKQPVIARTPETVSLTKIEKRQSRVRRRSKERPQRSRAIRTRPITGSLLITLFVVRPYNS
jgi:hypothetical protein